MINLPEHNTVGKEPKSKVKFRVVKNSWINLEDYKVNQNHELFLEFKEKYSYQYTIVKYNKLTNKEFKQLLESLSIRRVMILSRK